MSMRSYTTTTYQAHGLQKYQCNNLLRTHGEGLLFVFPTYCLEWERNKTKLLECNRLPDHAVAKVKAVNNGKHAQKADSNKAGGLFIFAVTVKLCFLQISRLNGVCTVAQLAVVDVLFLNGRRPSDDQSPQPDFVLANFSGTSCDYQ